MQFFGTLKLLMALLGPSWPGRSGPKMGPQNCPKSHLKSVQKLDQLIIPKITKNAAILGPEMVPKMDQDGEPGATEVSKKLLAPRCPQDVPGWPQGAPNQSQEHPKGAHDW